MADQEGEGSEQVAAKAPTVSRSTAIVALAVCFVAGYLLAGWWSGTRNLGPLEQPQCGPALLVTQCHLRTHALQQKAHSFDRLVGATEQRQRHGEAERLRGLEIDDQLDFRGLLDRQIGRLHALENLTRGDTDQMICIRKTGFVVHQTSGTG